MKIETVILEEKEYYIIETLLLNNKEYYILVNVDNSEDICIRKKIIELDEEYLMGLENELEFNLVMEEYRKKAGK